MWNAFSACCRCTATFTLKSVASLSSSQPPLSATTSRFSRCSKVKSHFSIFLVEAKYSIDSSTCSASKSVWIQFRQHQQLPDLHRSLFYSSPPPYWSKTLSSLHCLHWWPAQLTRRRCPYQNRIADSPYSLSWFSQMWTICKNSKLIEIGRQGKISSLCK